ncbi:MAG TPA: hypothetical protein VFJ01_06335 [Oleiagrimonas sp.]|nr:hypothetical protein [Oleiagrimonas sp.]
MNTRMFAVFSFVFVGGLLAGAPALAQNAMPASASSTMSQDSMHKHAMKGSMHKDMMKDSMHKHMKKDSMHKHGMMMKKDAMQKSAMKHTMKHKDDSMKSNKTGGKPASSDG